MVFIEYDIYLLQSRLEKQAFQVVFRSKTRYIVDDSNALQSRLEKQAFQEVSEMVEVIASNELQSRLEKQAFQVLETSSL